MNNTTRKLSPKNYIQFFLGIISLLLIAVTYSCEEDPSALGSNILPDSDKLNIKCDSSITFNCSVMDKHKVYTTNLQYYTLGIYEDNYFGSFKGEYVGQYLNNGFYENVDDVMVDSAVLYLQIDSVYGMPQDNIKFNVYELNEDILEDSIYYSDQEISNLYSTADLISVDSKINGDSLITISLSSAFANKFISNEDTIYQNDSLFKEIFKGISIIPEKINSPGGLVTVDLTSENTKIKLFYKTADEDSLSTSFSLTKGYRYAKYTNDYSSSIANNFIENSPSINDSLIFIQGLNGIKSKICFTNYKSWLSNDSSYSILDAELILPVYNIGETNFDPPGQLYLTYTDNDSTSIQIEDYTSGSPGGTYDKIKQQYTFNVSKHFEQLINGKIADSCLNFSFANNGYYPNRVVLKSANNIKFRVTYTKH